MKHDKLLFLVVLASSSGVWAGDSLPLLPTYYPGAGETYASVSLSRIDLKSATTTYGSGISTTSPNSTTRADTTSAFIQYGLNETLRIGITGSYVYGASSEPANTSNEATGWVSPSLSITKDIHLSSDEIASVSLGLTPKSGNTTLNSNQSTSISGRYSRALADDAWVSLTAGYIVQPGARPETASTNVSFVKDFGQYAASVGIGLSKTTDTHQNLQSNTERSMSYAFTAGISGRMTQVWNWLAQYNYGTNTVHERLDSGSGYLDTRFRSNGITVSFLTRF